MMLAFTDLKFRRRPILSALMVMLSVILLPLKDSSGSKVNGQQQQDFSNAHTQIQYSSSSPASKGKKTKFCKLTCYVSCFMSPCNCSA